MKGEENSSFRRESKQLLFVCLFTFYLFSKFRVPYHNDQLLQANFRNSYDLPYLQPICLKKVKICTLNTFEVLVFLLLLSQLLELLKAMVYYQKNKRKWSLKLNFDGKFNKKTASIFSMNCSYFFKALIFLPIIGNWAWFFF